ncbi:MAG: CDF family Co(II)/Ni(II) efflux transporter DmeF [Caulobacteraceae bacterium]
MTPQASQGAPAANSLAHAHVFLGDGHERNERRAWFVIVLCGIMMLVEIVGGLLFGSIALVADGLHMSTHAGALLLAALAYTFSRRHADDPRFTFGTGKLGDLAGFTSAIVLAMIALLIGYEAISRVFTPVPIHFGEAIPIAVLGLGVNVASAWLLSTGGHEHHHHGHGHGHGGYADAEDAVHDVRFEGGAARLEIFEDGVPPRFRLSFPEGRTPSPDSVSVQTDRQGVMQRFSFVSHGAYLESVEEIPEPHAFVAEVRVRPVAGPEECVTLAFEEHAHDHGHGHDNNMRAAIVHVMADAVVSLLVIVGLVLARLFGWLWMDPLAGMIGALVIASWSYGLVRDTGAILLDMNPDRRLSDRLRRVVEAEGDVVADLHLWRLGPGHLGAILSIGTTERRDAEFYRSRLAGTPSLSHLTVEVLRAPAIAA